MTNEQINIAIAEACGIASQDQWGTWYKTPLGWMRDCPDYCNDLNAMHEAERSNEMHFDQRWAETIVEIAHRESSMDIDRTDGWDWVLLVARLNPSQRAEAFLRTIGKWEEGSHERKKCCHRQRKE